MSKTKVIFTALYSLEGIENVSAEAEEFSCEIDSDLLFMANRSDLIAVFVVMANKTLQPTTLGKFVYKSHQILFKEPTPLFSHEFESLLVEEIKKTPF